MIFHRCKAYDKIINEGITKYRRIEFKRMSRAKRPQYACVRAVLYVNARGNRLLLSPFLQNTTPRSPIYRSLKRVDHRDRGGLHARAHVLDPSKKEEKRKRKHISFSSDFCHFPFSFRFSPHFHYSSARSFYSSQSITVSSHFSFFHRRLRLTLIYTQHSREHAHSRDIVEYERYDRIITIRPFYHSSYSVSFSCFFVLLFATSVP